MSRSETSGADLEWWRSGVIYQIWPRSFADGNGDGVGDLRGIIDHLDHLADLGVDAIWMSPIFPSPQVDGGYDVADYCDIDPELGTLADLDELVTEGHRRGIRVILDLVVNHTSDQHPWFVDSRSARGSDRRDWYFWRDPRPGMVGGEPGAEPNNWASRFGGPAWEWDATTGQYYLHLYAVEQPDLDWEVPAVREAVQDVVRFWLDRGVDGFRMDVITKIAKHPDLPDAPSDGGLADGSDFYLDQPRVHDHLQELRRTAVDVVQPRPVLIGEAFNVTIDHARRYTDPASGELDMVLAFDHVQVDRHGFHRPRPLDVDRLIDVLVGWQDELGDIGWSGLYWGNHDQPRAVSRFGDAGRFRVESATMLAAVLYLLRGTPFLYQGEEIGMSDPQAWALDQIRDVSARNHIRDGLAEGRSTDELLAEVAVAGRDNGRTPMRWTGGTHGGFSTVEPWIRQTDDPPWVSVEAQRDDPASILAFHRRLFALRRAEPAFGDGAFRRVLSDVSQLFAYERRLGDRCVLVVGRWSGDDVVVIDDALVAWDRAELLLGNHDEPARVSGNRLALRPWEVVVLRRVEGAR